jgi:hypothetical protein
MSKKTVLAACVRRMKTLGLSGKLRDDAAQHFLAGASAADPERFPDPATPSRYVDVLEALAECADEADAGSTDFAGDED